MWKLSVVRFLTAYGDIRSSPATATSMDEGVTDNPMEGKRRGLRVGGNWDKDPTSGLLRKRLLGPASSETQQINPPEEETGENPGGIREKERRYHEMESGSKRYPSQLALSLPPPPALFL